MNLTTLQIRSIIQLYIMQDRGCGRRFGGDAARSTGVYPLVGSWAGQEGSCFPR
jgi:hypothetical protein